MMRVLFLFGVFAIAANAAAFPEFSGDGYFNCTSCHVSTSGGDTLTRYGRSFAEEKLAFAAYEGEAMPFHKASLTPEWLLLGGHSRWIQIHYEDPKSKEGRFFNMQRSFDIGFQSGGFFSYLTLTQSRTGTYDYDDKSSPMLDRFLLRYDIMEALSVRYGLIAPKFGLGISDHNAWVRSKVELGIGAEEGLSEISWFSETIEINAAHSTFVPSDTRYIPNDKNKSRQSTYFNASAFIREKNRVSVSVLHRKKKKHEQVGGSVSATLAPGEMFRYSVEANSIRTKTEVGAATANSLFSQLTLWTMRGFYPGIRYEQTTVSAPDSSRMSLNRADKIAVNASFHPRPHFEFSASLGLRRNLEAYSFGETGFFMFHYWL